MAVRQRASGSPGNPHRAGGATREYPQHRELHPVPESIPIPEALLEAVELERDNLSKAEAVLAEREARRHIRNVRSSIAALADEAFAQPLGP